MRPSRRPRALEQAAVVALLILFTGAVSALAATPGRQVVTHQTAAGPPRGPAADPAPPTPHPTPTRTPAPRAAAVAKPEPKPAAAPAQRPSGGVMAVGEASWYGNPPCGAGGAAMLAYRWGMEHFKVEVSHAGHRIVAEVCDNGPHVPGRVIDLSRQLFAQLCPSCDGIIRGVVVRRLS